MRKCLSAPAAALLLTLTVLPASAQYVGEALPPFEVTTIVRSAGMDPLHRPVWKGGYYVVRAINPYGEEVRVIIHGRNGRIVSIQPVDSQDIDIARPGPRGAYPVPDYDDDGEFYDEGGRRLVPPRLSPPVISAPRTKPQTRQAAIDPATLPLPRPKPVEAQPAQKQPAQKEPEQTKPANQSASSESAPPQNPDGEIRVIELYKKPELPTPEGDAEKGDETPPVSPLEDPTPKPNL